MGIRLTEEELSQLTFGNVSTAGYKQLTDRDRTIGQAQLEKIVGEIKRNAYVALDKRTGEVELGSVIVSPEFWQALLKEAE